MLQEWFRRMWWWLTSSREQANLENEIRLHVELRAERLRSGGLNAEAAAAEARHRFGNTLRVEEKSREVWVSSVLDELWRDLRTSVRGLRRTPGFTAVAVVIIALGVGANTAIFQLFDALRLRSLAVPEPQQLAVIQLAGRKGWRGQQTRPLPTLTNTQWEYIRDHQNTFSGVLAWSADTFGFGSDPQPVRGLFVSGSYFRVLGVAAGLGRVFAPEDDHRGCGTPGAVISDAFWRRELAGDPAVIGRTIIVNYRKLEIIGVSATGFSGLEVGHSFDVSVPICSQAALWTEGNYLDKGTIWWLSVMGRLAPGQTIDYATARLQDFSPELFRATLPVNYPAEDVNDYQKLTLTAKSGGAGVSDLRDPYSDPLLLLLATTGVVLLIACANLATLILARASTREHEFAVRLAIGGSRSHLIRQLMVENGVLAIAGGVTGVFVAYRLSRFVIAFLSVQDDSIFFQTQPDSRVFSYAIAAAALSCIVFGLVPSWRVTRMLAGDSLRTSTRAVAGNKSGSDLRQGLVMLQVAFSFVLLFGALLFSGTLQNLLAVDSGFQMSDVVTGWIDYSRLKLPVARRMQFRREIVDEIRRMPGVASAAETGIVPLSGQSGSNAVWREGSDPKQRIDANFNYIGEGYLKTMAIPILSGRDFNAADRLSSRPVAIVSRTFIRRLGLTGDVVGQYFRREATPSRPETAFEIVGLVPDTKYISLKEEFRPLVFLSASQDNDPDPSMRVMIRASHGNAALIGAIRTTMKSKYPDMQVNLRTFESTVNQGLLRERLMATVSGFFGGLAVLIAAVGLYGVLSYLVVRRTNEIGVRVALGAKPADILKIFAGRAGMLVAAGLISGAIVALLAGQLARSFLFGLEPWDVRTILTAVVILTGVSLLASCLPAWRAAMLQPLAALRQD